MIRFSTTPKLLIVLLVLCLASGSSSAWARELFSGPVPATVIDVYDGDTIRVAAEVWPSHTIDVRIRIRGIDAPEIRSRCKAEKKAGYAARDYLARLIGEGRLYLFNISGGKYYNRVLADVHLANGTNLATKMLQMRMVEPYKGGKRNRNCQRFRSD